jgi:Amt family ammonium transporter
MGALVLGAIASPVCIVFCSAIKNALKYDDSLDAFGIHGVAGIIGAIGTGVVVSPDLGGAGWIDFSTCSLETLACDAGAYSMVDQVIYQAKAVGVTVMWATVASLIVFGLIRLTGLGRVSRDTEVEGLDINEHGERAYHS